MELLRRCVAIERGEKFYFTGKPCKVGHIALRFTGNGECRDCSTIRTVEYNATHKAENRAKTARWRERNPGHGAEYSKKWRSANPEKARAALAKWRADNPDRVREHARRVIAKNPQKNRDRMAAWVVENPDKHRTHGRNRRARMLAAEGKHTVAEIEALLLAQNGKCVYCGIALGSRFCADHIMPLSRGGSNWITNIQLTCRSCNSRKHAKDPVKFAQQLGRLL